MCTEDLLFQNLCMKQKNVNMSLDQKTTEDRLRKTMSQWENSVTLLKIILNFTMANLQKLDNCSHHKVLEAVNDFSKSPSKTQCSDS